MLVVLARAPRRVRPSSPVAVRAPRRRRPAPPAAAPAARATPVDARPTVDEARRPSWTTSTRTSAASGWRATRPTGSTRTTSPDDTEALAAARRGGDGRVRRAGHQAARRFDSHRGHAARGRGAKAATCCSLDADGPGARAIRPGAQELAAIETWMTSAYGKGQYCPPDGSPLLKYRKAERARSPPCLHLDELSHVLAKSRRPDELAEAWRGWHAIARADAREVRAVRRAREQGRARDRLRRRRRAVALGLRHDPGRVRGRHRAALGRGEAPLRRAPLLRARASCSSEYGKAKVARATRPSPRSSSATCGRRSGATSTICVVPYPREPSLDVAHEARERALGREDDGEATARASSRRWASIRCPTTFWERSLFTRPRDRDVVCHASAWDVTWTATCASRCASSRRRRTSSRSTTSSGHDFYFQRYYKLPILFQQGANDGFHEAIGDTMALSA